QFGRTVHPRVRVVKVDAQGVALPPELTNRHRVGGEGHVRDLGVTESVRGAIGTATVYQDRDPGHVQGRRDPLRYRHEQVGSLADRAHAVAELAQNLLGLVSVAEETTIRPGVQPLETVPQPEPHA